VSCSNIQEKIPNYLEDLLSEAERKSFRAHFGDCERCAEYALKQTSLAADLRRLNTLQPEFDLENLVSEAFQASRGKSGRRVSFFVKLLAAEVLVFAFLWVLYVQRYEVRDFFAELPQKIAAKASAIRPLTPEQKADQDAKAQFERLKTIQKLLSEEAAPS
jgi:hypothetical protein